MLKRITQSVVLSITIFTTISLILGLMWVNGHPPVHFGNQNEPKSEVPGNVQYPEKLLSGDHSEQEKNFQNISDKTIDAGWEETVLKNIQKQEYNISFDKSTRTYNSPNRKNNINFRYHKNGFTAKTMQTRLPLFDVNDPAIAESEKKYEVIPEWSVSISIDEQQLAMFNEELTTDKNTAKIENENIRINYTNNEEGMRQDFIIKKRQNENGKLRLNFHADTELKMIVGADALMFKDIEGQEKMKYSALKVWDANGKVLRAYFEKSNESNFEICVNDSEAEYPITIDPLSTSPNWVVTFGYSFGSASSPAGDVNGDGYGDVIIGAKETTTNFNEDGKVYLFLGSPSGLSTTAAWTGNGANANSHYGYSISTAGDVNGDGYSDVIIGEPGYKVGDSSRGRALVYLGSSGGLSTNPAWTVVGLTTDLGRAVSTAGDVNGDGYSDVIVTTAYGKIANATILGGAYLYLGSASGLSSTPNWEVNGTNYFENFGNSACTAGDINGDGFSDVVIGAPNYSISSSQNQGAAYAYYGSSSGLSGNEDWLIIGSQQGHKFGHSVYTAGDVNGDGFSDVIIGTEDSCKAYVYHGSSAGLSTTANWNITGASNSKFGYSVSTAGDFNGDGYSDVIVGATGTGNGQAFVYQGSSTGLSTNSVWTVSGDGTVTAFGLNVRTAGDVNGDGYSDVLICGYSPKAYVYNGSPAGFPTNNSWIFSGAGELGKSVASAGDVNGDGYSDVILGAPGYYSGGYSVGSFYIFHGSSAGLSTSPSFVKTGTISGSSLHHRGTSVASAGDVNGDGYSDVAVRIFTGTVFVTIFGGVEVYYGSSSGLNSTPAWSKSSTVSQDNYGSSIATAGDVNADGYSDIIVGAHGANGYAGEAFLFQGSSTGLSANANWSKTGIASSWYGYSVSSAGDVNGDGYGDVVVGAPELASYGGAYVYHGSQTGLSLNHNWHHQTPYPNSNYGISVACAGDVNGDGYSDVLIGQNKFLLYPIQAGAASCYYGSSTGLNPVFPEWFVEAVDPYFGHEFGGCVSGAGDVNGDGYSDVMISAPYPFGNVYCYYGSSVGLSYSYSRDYSSTTGPFAQRFGYSAASAGDVNGDGYSDVIIGAYFNDGGYTFLYMGNSGSGKSSFVQQYKPLTNNILSAGGWSESDGQVKYGILGNSSFGRADGKIIYEHRHNGTGFGPITNSSGSGSGTSFQDFGTNGTILNAVSSGLNSGKSYRWRARVQYSPVNNPFQKLGPWRFYNSQIPLPHEGFKPKAVPVIPMIPAEALKFDGADDRIALPDALTTNVTSGNAFSIEFWFKGTDIKSALKFQNVNGFIIVGHNGNHVISTDGGLGNGIQIGSVNDGQWHHIAVTWERNKENGFRSYLDGSPVGQRNSADVSLPNITTGGSIGGSSEGGDHMNGLIDELHIWNRALPEEEISYRTFCELHGSSFGLLANYHFNQGFIDYENPAVNTLYDSSGHSYHGSLINFALQGSGSNWSGPGLIPSGFSCSPGLSLLMGVIPQGFYNASGRLNMKDTVTAYIHSTTAPYNVVDSARSVLDSLTYEANFVFTNSGHGNYLISVKHRNSIETWSAYDEAFTIFGPAYFFFTYQPTAAYGNNLVLVGPGNYPYAIYSGDVNQDGFIDATDAGAIDNAAYNFVTGYVNTDLTGDGTVDASDAAIADNNAFNFVSAVVP